MTVEYSPLPQSEYVLKMKSKKPKFMNHNFSLGLGDPDIIKDVELWNYCCLTSRLPYLWEDSKVKPSNKPLGFSNLELAKFDLQVEVGDRFVKDYMTENSPEVYLEAVQDNPVHHLEICKFYGSELIYRSIVASRVYTWLTYRGVELDETQKAVIEMVRWSV